MKHLATPILEFVLTQPAHKLPVIFTLEDCPLPDCSDSPEDVLGEVLRLHKEGWIEAHVTRAVAGKAKQIEIRYVTLTGRNYLESRNTRASDHRTSSPLFLLGGAGLLIFILLLFWALGALGGRSASNSSDQKQAPSVSELSEAATLPDSMPSPTAPPTLTPVASPEPTLVPASEATPLPLPVASSSPSPLRKRVQR